MEGDASEATYHIFHLPYSPPPADMERGRMDFIVEFLHLLE